MASVFWLLAILSIPALSFDNTTTVKLTISEPKLTLNEASNLTVTLSKATDEDLVFNCTPSSKDLLVIESGDLVNVSGGSKSASVKVTAGGKGGTLYISTLLVKPQIANFSNIPDLDVCVVHSRSIDTVVDVIGWLAFASWSISFYPQVYKNWNRKSVVGLSFDFLGYNMLGWICYTAFNFCLLWVAVIRKQYHDVYPHGVINVQISDFAFSFHALILTAITIIQCLFYERGGQKPSPLCRLIIALFVCGMIMMFIVTASCCITWFQYVSVFSYVKLAVTLFKYSPQVYVNFKNKSTEAVSIYQFLLDMTGGFLSLFQMGLIAYNYDDWKTFIGDFTKFGLATLSILYDLIFIVQHYCLYRAPAYRVLEEEKVEESGRLLEGEGVNHYEQLG